MKRKVIIVAIILLSISLVAMLGVYLVKGRSKSKLAVNPSLDGVRENSMVDTSATYSVWDDQAGFTFSYPKDWLFDVHEQDVTNYANIDITKQGFDGGIKILATDSKYKTILDWTNKDAFVAGSSFMETKLSGVNAQKALLKTGGMVVGIVDEGVLFTLELKPDESGYWESEYNKVIASFMLVYPTSYPAKSTNGSSVAVSGGTSGNIIEEAEEVIE